MIDLMYGNPPVSQPSAPLEVINIDIVYKTITTSQHLKKVTEQVRVIQDKAEKTKQKQTILPYILPFKYSELTRNSKNFVSTNSMMFEADHVDKMEEKIATILKDKSVALLYRSVSGDGFKFLIQLNQSIDIKYHLRLYNVLRLMLNKKFKILLDPSSKDLARVQFLAYDKAGYFNPKASKLDVDEYIKGLELYDKAPTERASKTEYNYSHKDIKEAIQFIREKGYLDIKDEQLWWELSMSIASLGDEGLEYFLLLSRDHPLYPQDTEVRLKARYQKFKDLWGNYHDEERLLNMNAFFNIIEKRYKYKSPRTKTIGKKSVEFRLADYFSKMFYNQLLFDHSKVGKIKTYGWYMWDGMKFSASKKGEISDYYLKMLEHLKQNALKKAKGEDEEDEEITINARSKDGFTLPEVSRAESRRYRDLTLTWAGEKEGLGVLPDELDQNIELFNVLNGVINLRTQKLLNHSPDFKITKSANVVYQKNAKCPYWEEFILKISFNNSAIASYIQEAVGYSLTGHTSEQCLFFLYGIGANGKSTFLEGLKLVFGDYQVHANYETFTSLGHDGSSPSEDVVRLKSSRLVISTEINAQRSLNESVIKQITSGDTITARDLHSSSIEFTPTFKLWIAGNHKPKIQNFDRGIKRRIFIIPFEYIFTQAEIKPQYEVVQQFEQEKSGILNWALEGAHRWFKNRRLHVPEEVINTTREYFVENNVIEQFINDNCIIYDPDDKETIGLEEQAKNLYSNYIEYTTSQNEERLGRNQFYSRLEELGYKRAFSSNQQLIFRNIKIHTNGVTTNHETKRKLPK